MTKPGGAKTNDTLRRLRRRTAGSLVGGESGLDTRHRRDQAELRAWTDRVRWDVRPPRCTRLSAFITEGNDRVGADWGNRSMLAIAKADLAVRFVESIH